MRLITLPSATFPIPRLDPANLGERQVYADQLLHELPRGFFERLERGDEDEDDLAFQVGNRVSSRLNRISSKLDPLVYYVNFQQSAAFPPQDKDATTTLNGSLGVFPEFTADQSLRVSYDLGTDYDDKDERYSLDLFIPYSSTNPDQNVIAYDPGAKKAYVQKKDKRNFLALIEILKAKSEQVGFRFTVHGGNAPRNQGTIEGSFDELPHHLRIAIVDDFLKQAPPLKQEPEAKTSRAKRWF